MNLIMLERREVEGADEVRLSGVRAAHLRNVLKAVPGQEVRVGLLDGPYGVATVVSAAGGDVVLRCAFEPATPERPAVDLLLALPRPKVMRRLWAQLAAIGVGRIILTNAERVERDYFGTHVLSPETYRPLLIEGLQQARDTRLPEVTIHRRFKVLVEDELDALFKGRHRLVANPAPVEQAAAFAAGRTGERCLLAVGPEGGWNAFELGLLQAHAFRPVGMGSRILRTDTACIALLALVHAAMHTGQ